jgi:sigma-B regulation protein RsbU (phosphoserine phosphatase)
LDQVLWDWYQQDLGAKKEFIPGDRLPWSDKTNSNHIYFTSIFSEEDQKPLGGICLMQTSFMFADIPTDPLPAMQVLAAQIASAMHAAEVISLTMEHQKVSQELKFAGEIQTSFLPDQIPELEGWQITANLYPARETSGDFYDFIPLPDGQLGIVLADVTDKGVGAALFMALSRTLIRTYAWEYPSDPGRVLSAVNQRIILDSKSGLFVTVFYAVLDPIHGILSYANAGHNPPYYLNGKGLDSLKTLKASGMALGIFEEEGWEQGSLLLCSSDVLVIYSDGITEAQNTVGDFFGEDRLLDTVRAKALQSAQEIRAAIMAALNDFTGDAEQSDDVTLIVLSRD